MDTKDFAALAVTVNITTNNISFRDRPTGLVASISLVYLAQTQPVYRFYRTCLDLSTESMFANRRHQMVAKQPLFIWLHENRYPGLFRERFTFLFPSSCAFNFNGSIKKITRSPIVKIKLSNIRCIKNIRKIIWNKLVVRK